MVVDLNLETNKGDAPFEVYRWKIRKTETNSEMTKVLEIKGIALSNCDDYDILSCPMIERQTFTTNINAHYHTITVWTKLLNLQRLYPV